MSTMTVRVIKSGLIASALTAVAAAIAIGIAPSAATAAGWIPAVLGAFPTAAVLFWAIEIRAASNSGYAALASIFVIVGGCSVIDLICYGCAYALSSVFAAPQTPPGFLVTLVPLVAALLGVALGRGSIKAASPTPAN